MVSISSSALVVPSPSGRALELCRCALTDKEWEELNTCGTVTVIAKKYVYMVSRDAMTRVFRRGSRRLYAHACLQLSIPAPINDRVLAEVLLIKNDEKLYLKTANVLRVGSTGDVFFTTVMSMSIALMLYIVIDILRGLL